jgi:hypothetical protein
MTSAAQQASPRELRLHAGGVLLLDVARCRAAARVLCRLDAGERLRLDAAVGRSWTSRFPTFYHTPTSGKDTKVSSVQEYTGSPQGV